MKKQKIKKSETIRIRSSTVSHAHAYFTCRTTLPSFIGYNDPTWNDGALDFSFEERRPNKNNNNHKMNNDMGKVPDPKILK